MNYECDVPRLSCPEKIIGPRDVDGVLTESEFTEKLVQERDEALQECECMEKLLQQEVEKVVQERDEALKCYKSSYKH